MCVSVCVCVLHKCNYGRMFLGDLHEMTGVVPSNTGRFELLDQNSNHVDEDYEIDLDRWGRG